MPENSQKWQFFKFFRTDFFEEYPERCIKDIYPGIVVARRQKSSFRLVVGVCRHKFDDASFTEKEQSLVLNLLSDVSVLCLFHFLESFLELLDLLRFSLQHHLVGNKFIDMRLILYLLAVEPKPDDGNKRGGGREYNILGNVNLTFRPSDNYRQKMNRNLVD